MQGTSTVTAQTGKFNISGTGIAATLQASSHDTAGAVAMSIGNTNATSVNIGNTTNNIATTVNGTAIVKPTTGHDSTTAFQVQNAAGSATIFNIDTTNSQVSIRNLNDAALTGSELFLASNNQTFSHSAANWSVTDNTFGQTVTATGSGATVALGASPNLNGTAGVSYQITYTVSANFTGTIKSKIGGIAAGANS